MYSAYCIALKHSLELDCLPVSQVLVKSTPVSPVFSMKKAYSQQHPIAWMTVVEYNELNWSISTW